MCRVLLWVDMPSRSWAGERKMAFLTGSVPTPGTLTGVITVSRDTFLILKSSLFSLFSDRTIRGEQKFRNSSVCSS